MRLARQSFLVAGLFLAAACGSNSNGPDEYQAAVPTFSGVSSEGSGPTSEEASLSASPEAMLIAPAASTELQGSNSPEWLPKIRDAIRSLNEGLKNAYAPLERLVLTSGPSQVRGPVSYTHLRAHETPEHLVCRL